MQFGEYSVVRSLGKGGMSEVFEVEHVRLGSRHALKLFTYGGDVAEVRDRFLAEGKLLARLNHPRIVKVQDIGVEAESGRPYFVMDLVLDAEGDVKSLADVEAGGADESQVAVWYDDLREGLAYIHGHGVIHRDLKLQNVLIGPDGHVVLADFGISKVTDDKLGKKLDPVQTLVRMQDGKAPVMGSLGYMAPELEMGVAATPASDWYALGVIVFKLLTGVWCDARTDVVGDLDGYDAVWKQILPKLLHANPEGRACLSWRDLKNEADEQAAMDAENALMAAEERSRKMRIRFFAAVSVAAVLAIVAGIGLVLMLRPEMPDFESIVRVPDDAPSEETETMPSREEFIAAQADAWVLTHDVFEKLRRREITLESAKDSLRHAMQNAASDDSRFPDWYQENAESDALLLLLNAAVSNLETRVWK